MPTDIELSCDGRTQAMPCGAWDAGEASLDMLAEALAGSSEPDWVDAARSVELTETIARSLSKGRTIELHFEEYTEQGTFKGTMTSLGCGLLVLGMLLLGVVAIGEQAGVPYTRYWPYLLLAAFGFFLLLQLLMLVFQKPAAAGPSDAPAAGDASNTAAPGR
jgi:myo-inositol 2-dehydrogenase/D-chiro-inositol 1-dehydrogenase